jgi:hypothetical protein
MEITRRVQLLAFILNNDLIYQTCTSPPLMICCGFLVSDGLCSIWRVVDLVCSAGEKGLMIWMWTEFDHIGRQDGADA